MGVVIVDEKEYDSINNINGGIRKIVHVRDIFAKSKKQKNNYKKNKKIK